MLIDRRTLLALPLGLSLGLQARADAPAARVGALAPAFDLRDTEGRTVSSTTFAGKTIVLEWTNPECPYVAKHYGTGNLQALQREAATAGVVWLTISSAAPGNVGYLDALEGAELIETRKASPAHLLLDHDGAMLTAYGVSVALTMAIIDAKGTLAYIGAIDDRPTAKPADVAGARNYVREALAALADGRTVKPAQTRPYGCVAR